MDDERETRETGRGGIGEGLRTGLGVLNAFREAIEETVGEAIESGDVSPERARALMRDAAQRVQSSFDETRERFDFPSRREIESLRDEVAALRARVDALEGRDGGEGTGEHSDIIIVSE